MNIKLPEKVNRLIALLEGSGYEAYAVGGCVRDSLLELIPRDWDITTAATPDEMKRCFEGHRIIETGIQHGTLTVVLDGEMFEVTTFRVDGEYVDNRRPKDVAFVRNLEDDLARRDFTVNAMAYNDRTGLYDPFGGAKDLKAQLIRCVGDPDRRFGEDALRIIRALRFASVYGFEIEERTAESIHRNKPRLLNIAVERISIELNKLLCGQGVEKILRDDADVLAVFIPEIVPMFGFEQYNRFHVHDVWIHTLVSVAAAPADKISRLCMLLHDIGKPESFHRDEQGVGHFYGHPARSARIAEAVLRRLKYDHQTIDAVTQLVRFHDADITPNASNVKRLLNKMGEEKLRQLLKLKLADYTAQNPQGFEQKARRLGDFTTVLDRVLEAAQCFSLKELAVSGIDLIELGVRPGPEIGRLLQKLLELVMSDAVENTKEALLKAASGLVDK